MRNDVEVSATIIVGERNMEKIAPNSSFPSALNIKNK